MSFIDTFAHEYIATFSGIPVYHPLQPISGEFSAGPDTLLLGGGSGEHPALVIRNLEDVAGWYVEHALENACDPFDPEEIIERSSILRKARPATSFLDFAHWSVEDYAGFFTRCTSAMMQQPYVRNEQHGSLENWLMFHFGKLLCLSLPDLVPALEGDMKEAWDFGKRFTDHGTNFVCAPPGFPVSGGRRLAGPLNEGLSAWKHSRRLD